MPTRIDIASGDLSRKVDQAWTAILTDNDPVRPEVLLRGNDLIQVSNGEILPYDPFSMQERLSVVGEFGRWRNVANTQAFITQDPPMPIVKSLLARPASQYPGAPKLTTSTDVPVLSKRAEIITTAGYHPEEELWFEPAPGLEDLDIEKYLPGSVQELQLQRDWIFNELLSDFGFKDRGSIANAWALMLLPFVGHFIDGPTPLHVVYAHEPGTGKTLLSQSLLYPGCGLMATTPASSNKWDDEEMRKRITAMLMQDPRAILLDNISEKLESGSLAAALTTGIWQDRILGQSLVKKFAVRTAWVGTGNNIQLSQEQARRSVPILLEAGKVNPSKRAASEFRHPDLLEWAHNSRRDLVGKILGLIYHWTNYTELHPETWEFMRGQTLSPETGEWVEVDTRGHEVFASDIPTLGSYTRWGKVIGSILKRADISGFLTNHDQLISLMAQDTNENVEFIKAIYDWSNGEPVTGSEIAAQMGYGGELHDDTPLKLQGVRDASRAMGYWLRDNAGANLGGYKAIKYNQRKWRIVPVR